MKLRMALPVLLMAGSAALAVDCPVPISPPAPVYSPPPTPPLPVVYTPPPAPVTPPPPVVPSVQSLAPRNTSVSSLTPSADPAYGSSANGAYTAAAANNANADRTAAAHYLAGLAKDSDGKVAWYSAVEYASEKAAATKQPYALYFCTESSAQVAGAGAAGIAEYKKTHEGRSPPPTIFDNPDVLAWFNAAEISIFAKIPLTQDNQALADKWNAHENTLVIVAPNGEKLEYLGRMECTDNAVMERLSGFKDRYKAWLIKTGGDVSVNGK